MFKCKHPFKYLGVMRDHTIIPLSGGCTRVEYNLLCRKCGKELILPFARHQFAEAKDYVAT